MLRFSYWPTGQVHSDQRNASSDYIFKFNGSGRMATAYKGQSLLATYTYNGLEERAMKAAAAATTDFLYDRAGHMIAEANHATHAMIREYIWMDDLPVAMVDYSSGSPAIYDIHADHLGRPQKLTDQTGAVVWSANYDPFGIPAGITGSVTMPLMFPGQYWDSETQLSQNWNRDYDSSIGRYIESDPIGLWGGINTYAYVYNEPMGLIDPSGTGALGSIIGGAPGSLLEDLLNAINRLAINTTGGVCPEDPDRCKKAADMCYEECEHLLGKGGRTNQGVPYRNCWVRCMKRYGCYKGDSPVE